MIKRKVLHSFIGVALGLLLGFIVANWTGVRVSAVTHDINGGDPSLVVGDEGKAFSDHSQVSEEMRSSILLAASHAALPDDASPQQSAGTEKPAEQVFKNIQSLKGLPASQLYATMNFMKVSLGVKCDHCHVRTADGKWNWESDDKPAKQFTRRMIQLTVESNKIAFGGRTQVSCYTCHRGKTDPVNLPPISLAAEDQKPNAATTKNGAPVNAKPAAVDELPTVDMVMNKYAEATGGNRAVENFKTQFVKGTFSEHLLPTSPLEIYMAAPNKMLAIITTPKGTLLQGYNGATGWTGNGKEARELSGASLVQLKRRADFYGDWKLKEQFTRMRVAGKEKINDREAYVLTGRTVDNRTERLYFDTQTGLLLRRVAYTETMIGMIPEATDFEDYRQVGGVKIPFTRRSAQLDGFEASTLKFLEVKFNVPVDDAKFNLPAAQK